MVATKPPFCHMIHNILSRIRTLFLGPRKLKESWAFVGTVGAPVSHSGVKGTIYYHLFESNFGRRKYECQCTITMVTSDHLNNVHQKMAEYNEKVFPWMWGHYIEGISTYNTVSQDILIDKLSSQSGIRI